MRKPGLNMYHLKKPGFRAFGGECVTARLAWGHPSTRPPPQTGTGHVRRHRAEVEGIVPRSRVHEMKLHSPQRSPYLKGGVGVPQFPNFSDPRKKKDHKKG